MPKPSPLSYMSTPPLSCVLFIHVDKTQVKATLGDVSTSKVVMLKYYIQDRTLWSFSVGGKLCFLAEEYGSLWEKVHATDCPLGLGKIQCCDLGSLSVKKAWLCLATLPGCCVNLLNIHKAPWKWRGLHKSLVLFTQQTFSPENKVVNGTIVLLVERVQSFRSQLVDQVVGGCMDFLCSRQAPSKTAAQ